MIKVAIVEDNKTTREGFATLIKETPGLECVCACETVKDAVRLIPKLAPDVVLMDIQLPDKTGIECAARIKELIPSVQILVVTVYADQTRIFEALQSGASGYLLKRSAPEQIITAIQDVYEGGVPMTPEIARKVIAQFKNQTVTTQEIENLSSREREVLQLLTLGLNNKTIAERCSISVEGVKWHLRNIYQKLHVHSRLQAAGKFLATKRMPP
ncbi:MAG TPA: response regulator transcription factor [Verrucomicrobiae bacterium]|nr:response regulator transcription factor [Verrucomicrobiae bacterium]